MDKDKFCVDWGNKILELNGYKNWSIKLIFGKTDDGVVIFETKSIILYWQKGQPNFGLILHEITHVIMGSGGHDSEFAHQYMRMVNKYFIPRSDNGNR